MFGTYQVTNNIQFKLDMLFPRYFVENILTKILHIKSFSYKWENNFEFFFKEI